MAAIDGSLPDPRLDAARGRVEALFGRLDRLTTDDLARIALAPADDQQRRAARAAAARAAVETGRQALMEEARAAAREGVLGRYAAGTYRPTWAGLNWGLSMGPAASRAAVVEAVEDATAAAVVEDVLDAEAFAELSLDAEHLVALAPGGPPEGVLRVPSRSGRAMRLVTILVVVVVLMPIGLAAGGVLGLAGVAVIVAVLLASMRAPTVDGDDRPNH